MDHSLFFGRMAICFLAFLFGFSSLFAQSPKNIYSSGIQLEGKIGGKYPIHMRLSGDDVHEFFDFESTDCRDVSGSYCYLSKLIPIALTGRICPSNHTITLANAKNGAETERFEGKWDAIKHAISGEWTLSKSGKVLAFQLVDVALEMKPVDLQVFAQLLNQVLGSGESDWAASQYEIESVLWKAPQIEIANFVAAEGRIVHFSNTRIEFEHNYSNAGHGTDTYEIFQLLPNTTGHLALQLTQNRSIESSEEEGNETCDYTFELWEYQHFKWEPIGNMYGFRSYPNPFQPSGNDCDTQIEVLPNWIKIGGDIFPSGGTKFVVPSR